MKSAAVAVPLTRAFTVGPLWSLFVLTLRQLVRGRRLLVLAALFSLPAALAAAVCLTVTVAPGPDALEFSLAWNLIPHALAPLAALLYAAGIIQDEVEEQTLTYLLLRPLPRWALCLVRLLAAYFVAALLTAVFTALTFGVIALVAHEPARAGLVTRVWQTAAALILAQFAYCGLFGLLGLLTRRSLLVGVGYIIFFEGLLATFDTVARRLTVMYYFRVLVLRGLDPESGKDWSIDLARAPTTQTCVLVLLGTGLVGAVLAALVFARREFRVKTPEST